MEEIIKKLIEYAIFPPGIIIIAFLVISAAAKKVKIASALCLFFALGIYIFSIAPVKNALISPLEKAYSKPVLIEKLKPKPDAIVILGAGAYNGTTLDGDSLNRLAAGLILYRKLNIPIIFSGGYATSTVSTAIIARNILLKLGVKKSDIRIDDRSFDTNQNALYTARICKKNKFKRIILVTSAYHMKRSVFLFKKTFKRTGIGIIPYPSDYKANSSYNFFSFMPDLGNLMVSSEAMHEYLGIIYYKYMWRNR